MAKSRTETLEELRKLEVRRGEIRLDKKISNQDFRDQAKDVEDQIKKVLEELKTLVE